ncbi:Glu/Leu/Phe/Val dehydrogenase [Candidatus Gottesmanbacteria bacterium]|nr:Glu/Leu/Phe/Val dehydrogenase [Candidatus Gottesmanbacteria bacterium]
MPRPPELPSDLRIIGAKNLYPHEFAMLQGRELTSLISERPIPGLGKRLRALERAGEKEFLAGARWRALHAYEQVAKDHPELNLGPEMADRIVTPSQETYIPLEVEYKGEIYHCLAARAWFDDWLQHPDGHIRKGGIRYVSVKEIKEGRLHRIANEKAAEKLMKDDVKALGLEMLLKNFGVNFKDFIQASGITALAPEIMEQLDVIGGAKGVIVGPRDLHEPDHQDFIKAVLKEYAKQMTLRGVVGSRKDVPAGDIGTTTAGAMDAFVEGHRLGLKGEIPENEILATVTGKNVGNGGNEARATATAFGTKEALMLWAKRKAEKAGISVEAVLQSLRVVFDGAGNAALPAAKALAEMGVKVVGMTDTKSAIYCESGLTVEDIDGIERTKEKRGSLAKFAAAQDLGRITTIAKSEAEIEDGKRWLWNKENSGMNVLFASSAERIINESNVEAIPNDCLIIDGANGPVTPKAEKRLIEKGIEHFTGSYANAGGVIASLVEWAANMADIKVSKKQTEAAIKYVMKRNFEEMYALVESGRVASLAEAFYFLAMERIVMDRLYKVEEIPQSKIPQVNIPVERQIIYEIEDQHPEIKIPATRLFPQHS